jgi:hypothetical protein
MTTIANDSYGTALPPDLETAIKMIASLRVENSDLKKLTEVQKEQIRILKAREYGRSSEKRTAEDIRQAKLFDEAEVYSTAPAQADILETVKISKAVYTRKVSIKTTTPAFSPCPWTESRGSEYRGRTERDSGVLDSQLVEVLWVQVPR